MPKVVLMENFNREKGMGIVNYSFVDLWWEII